MKINIIKMYSWCNLYGVLVFNIVVQMKIALKSLT